VSEPRTFTIELPRGATMREATRAFKRAYADLVLGEHETTTAAARALGLSREGLYKIRRLTGLPASPIRCDDCACAPCTCDPPIDLLEPGTERGYVAIEAPALCDVPVVLVVKQPMRVVPGMWGAGDSANPSTLYYSVNVDPEDWNGSDCAGASPGEGGDVKDRLRKQALDLIRFAALQAKKGEVTTEKAMATIERQLEELRELGFGAPEARSGVGRVPSP